MSWEQRQRLHKTSSRTAWDQELPHSEMYPPNMTVNWLDTDSIDSAKFERDITYTFNEHGFRADSFYDEPSFRIVTCGCSMTVGVGVSDDETWPAVLKAKVQEFTGETASNWNLATSGASPDYVTRILHKIDTVLYPELVFVYWPPIARLELPAPYEEGKVIQTAIGDLDFPKILVDEDYLLFNFKKNLNFLKSLYNNHSAIFYSDPVVNTLVQNQMQDNNPFVIDTGARDGMHPSPEWHDRVAEYFFQMAKPRIVDMIRHRERDKVKETMGFPVDKNLRIS